MLIRVYKSCISSHLLKESVVSFAILVSSRVCHHVKTDRSLFRVLCSFLALTNSVWNKSAILHTAAGSLALTLSLHIHQETEPPALYSGERYSFCPRRREHPRGRGAGGRGFKPLQQLFQFQGLQCLISSEKREKSTCLHFIISMAADSGSQFPLHETLSAAETSGTLFFCICSKRINNWLHKKKVKIYNQMQQNYKTTYVTVIFKKTFLNPDYPEIRRIWSE